MKCILDVATSKISRVSDKVADQLVSQGKAKYIEKKAWKKNVRDVVVVVPAPPVEKPPVVKPKADKKHQQVRHKHRKPRQEKGNDEKAQSKPK